MKTKNTLIALLSVLLFSLTTTIVAQNNTIKKNTFFIEGLGTSLLYSINYDRLMPIHQQFKLSTRVGFTFLPAQSDGFLNGEKGAPEYLIPISVHLLIGKKQHYADIGVGHTFRNTYQTNNSEIAGRHTIHWLTSYIGYRYQKNTGGLFLRAGYNPLLQNYTSADPELVHSFNVGLGYSF